MTPIKFEGGLAVLKKRAAWIELYGSSPTIKAVSNVVSKFGDPISPDEGEITVIDLGRTYIRVLHSAPRPSQYYVMGSAKITWVMS